MDMLGFALAAVAAVLFAVVIPKMTLRRTVLADAPLKERFSENLRLVNPRPMVMVEAGDRGNIYLTERIMKTAPAKKTLRDVARDRAAAKARMADRAAFRSRGMAGVSVLALVSLVLWILTGTAGWPTWLAFISTMTGGVALAGLGYLMVVWTEGDAVDADIIEKTSARLDAARPVSTPHLSAAAARRAESRGHGVSVTRANDAEVTSADALVASDLIEEAQARPEIAATPTEPVARPYVVTESRDDIGAKAGADSDEHVIRTVRSGVSAGRHPNTVPSYTLKRRVKPLEVPEGIAAPVPYRPQAVGERIGEAELGAPNPAPEMSGNEELRSGLFGGMTLDELLNHRRA